MAVSGVWDRLGAGNTYSQDEALCAAGVPIKIEDLGGLLHHKFLILDATGANPVVITGSMNWTGAGAGSNDENTLIIHDAAVAQAYLAAYQELYDALGPETLCETGGGGFLAYLPLVLRPVAAPTPTATPTLPPGPLPTATPTATPSATPEPGGESVVIDDIFYDGAGSSEPDEYVVIRNAGGQSVDLGGWTLRDEANRVFTFPAFTMTPGQVCRVYTNEEHPEWCGFNYGSGSAIWNNGGDCATLQDGDGVVVDVHCYP